jgi:hypothetical protein
MILVNNLIERLTSRFSVKFKLSVNHLHVKFREFSDVTGNLNSVSPLFIKITTFGFVGNGVIIFIC